MTDDDREVIRNEIAPLLQKAEVSLLLGAGFSVDNSSGLGRRCCIKRPLTTGKVAR